MKKIKIATVLAALLSLLLPVRSMAGTVSMGENDSTGDADTVPVLWLSLEECRRMALENNESLQRADNAALQACLDKRVALAAWFPKIEGTATGVYMFENLDVMGMELQMKGMYMAGITLQQPVYAGGKLAAGSRLAKLGEESAAQDQRKTRMEVIASADHAYWTYLATLKKVGMLETYAALMDTLCMQLEGSVEASMAIANDLLQVKAEQGQIRYSLQKARNGAELCRMALCHEIGLALDAKVCLSDTVLDVSVPGPEEVSIEERPELALLRYQVEARKQQAKMTLGDMLPTAGLAVGYTYVGNVDMRTMVSTGQGSMPYDYQMDFGIPLAMLAVKIPLTEWGAGAQKLRKSRIEVRNAELELRQNERLMTIEAQQAALRLGEGQSLMETARLSVEHATENLRVMQDRYRVQMCSLGDLLDAHAQWQQARSDLIEAQTQYRIDETEFLKTTGRL